MMFEAISHFHQQRYKLSTWCVMPNHVHVLSAPLEGRSLDGVVQAWKSYTAHRANQLLGRQGRFWMPEYFDHLIRDAADFEHAHRYILRNPEKAGLKGWEWVGTNVEGV
jgi:menaquinone-specific isochorismate synthase